MSAQSAIEVPELGDDFLPNRRAIVALPLTVMYWALVFTAVFFATRDVRLEDSVAASGYIGALLITFMMVIFFIIPTSVLAFGRVVDESTAELRPSLAALRFSLIGLVLGVIPAAFIFFVNTAYGWLPFTQFIIPSALAGGLARLTIEPALRKNGLRYGAYTFTGIVVVGSLSIGWVVFNGGL